MCQVYTITFASMYFYYKGKAHNSCLILEYKVRCILFNFSKAPHLISFVNNYEFIVSMSCLYKHVASQHFVIDTILLLHACIYYNVYYTNIHKSALLIILIGKWLQQQGVMLKAL